MKAKYENLRVWAEAMDLSEQVYAATNSFPRREDFALTVQIRRAVVSIATNIAEGSGRYHTREFLQFLFVARGSLFELMTLSALSLRFRYLSSTEQANLRSRCELLLIALSGLVRSLERRARA